MHQQLITQKLIRKARKDIKRDGSTSIFGYILVSIGGADLEGSLNKETQRAGVNTECLPRRTRGYGIHERPRGRSEKGKISSNKGVEEVLQRNLERDS